LQPFQDYILVIGAFQGLLLFLLLATDRRISSVSQLLGVLCLFLGLFLCVPLIINAGPDGKFFRLTGWLFYLPASIGGISYIYCRNSVLAIPPKVRDLVHILPLLLCYLLVIDYIVFAPEKLAGWIQGGTYSSFRLVLSEYLLFAQALFYFPRTLRLIFHYRQRANETLANFNPNTFRWLALFMILSLCVWVLKAIFAFVDHMPAVIYYGSDIMIVIFIYVIATAQWRHPQLFTIHKHGARNLTASLKKDADDLKQQDGVLEPGTRAEMLALVKEKVEGDELYRDSDLTLARLANATGLNTHHLSEVLNQQSGQNFYQFVNGYRVNYVCDQLKQDSESRILDIAMAAGFSSKSTFNSIFKQFKGITPTTYRKTTPNKD